MIGMPEVDFRINVGFSGDIKEVFCEWDWIAVLLGNFVEAAEIHT